MIARHTPAILVALATFFCVSSAAAASSAGKETDVNELLLQLEQLNNQETPVKAAEPKQEGESVQGAPSRNYREIPPALMRITAQGSQNSASEPGSTQKE